LHKCCREQVASAIIKTEHLLSLLDWANSLKNQPDGFTNFFAEHQQQHQQRHPQRFKLGAVY
jgi:hypothetical protein